MIHTHRCRAWIVILSALAFTGDVKAQDTEGFLEADFFGDIRTFAHIAQVNMNVWCEPQVNQKLTGGGTSHNQDRESINLGWVLREELCAGGYQCTMEYELENILGPNPLGQGTGGVVIVVQVESAVPFEFMAEGEVHAGQSDVGLGIVGGLVLAIHSDWQEWFLFPTCLRQDKPVISVGQSDTNYIIQHDKPTTDPVFLRMTPDAVVDPKSDPSFVDMRGLAAAQGVLEPGRYTILLESKCRTNQPDPSQNHGRASLRLVPIACEADINFDGLVNTDDIVRLIDGSIDLDCDQDFDYFDISAFIYAYISGC